MEYGVLVIACVCIIVLGAVAVIECIGKQRAEEENARLRRKMARSNI